MISAIVFDFDGVLADSETLHLRAYQQVLAPRGGQMSRADYFARYLGFDDDGVFRTFASDRGWKIDDRDVAALVAEKTAVFESLETNADLLFPGAADCVRRMAGEFPLGIASGALRHEIEVVLDRTGLRDCFRFIVASGDTPSSKPAPDPYIRAAALHAREPGACLAIEDSRWGIESAKAAGMACVGITQSYAREELAAADRIIDSLDELTPELVRSLGRPTSSRPGPPDA
jgi:beta-phosphoglucomutase-like phosphatase (HAD superfamily)